MTAPRGIHYRRRWFYALWAGLLLLSLAAWAMWERPSATVQAALAVKVHIRQAPAGTQVQVWAGPWARWQGLEWAGAEAPRIGLQTVGTTALPVVGIVIARRRWLKQYIPRGTWDLMMLKFTAPSGPARYFALPLSQDIRSGLLRPRGKLTTTIDVSWASLRVDGKPPDRLP